jgi:hypothetical protein
MSRHYKVVCSECDTVIGQCRCPSPTKRTTYEVCKDCKEKKVEDEVHD